MSKILNILMIDLFAWIKSIKAQGMVTSFYCQKRWAKWAWGGGLLLLISLLIQVYITVLLNDWYGRFYDLIRASDKYPLSDAYACMWLFIKLATPYVFIYTATNWFTRVYALRWREAMSNSYWPRWVKTTKDIEGASQRIQQDTERFSRIVEGLGLQVVRSIMTVIAFLPVLWKLSENINVPFMPNMPGCLVWVALLVAFGATVVSWFVGWYLPKLEYNNQVVEAAYRKELVHAEDYKHPNLLPNLTELFTGVRFNYQKLFLYYGYFDLWVIMYDQIMVVVPYLIALPAYWSAAITLGSLVQISNAFGKVWSGFALFVHNWTTITELRSIWRRLHEFQRNLDKQDV